MRNLHPFTKLLLVIFLVWILVMTYLCNYFISFSLSALVFIVLLAIIRRFLKHFITLFTLSFIVLFLLYSVNLKNLSVNFENLGYVIYFLTRSLIILDTFLLAYLLLSREEFHFIMSKILPEKIAVGIVSIIYFLQISEKRFSENLNYQKLKLGENLSILDRLLLLPNLIRFLFVSLLNDITLYEISYRNKLIGNNCKNTKQRIMEYTLTNKDIGAIVLVLTTIVLSLLMFFYFKTKEYGICL